MYNKQQLKHRLNANSLYVVSTKSGGFSIEVTNNLSSTVALVGVRVMVGHKSIEKAPSFVEVFGRTHQVKLVHVQGFIWEGGAGGRAFDPPSLNLAPTVNIFYIQRV